MESGHGPPGTATASNQYKDDFMVDGIGFENISHKGSLSGDYMMQNTVHSKHNMTVGANVMNERRSIDKFMNGLSVEKQVHKHQLDAKKFFSVEKHAREKAESDHEFSLQERRFIELRSQSMRRDSAVTAIDAGYQISS